MDPHPDQQSTFQLSKWYLDCVTPDGDAFVGYVASLHWQVLHLSYSSILIRERSGHIAVDSSFTDRNIPAQGAHGISWESHLLGVRGSWHSRSSPFDHCIYQTPAGALHWHCLQPSSDVSVNLADGREFQGLGYAERLDLTIPPWQLPITELRWGRFVAEEHSLVWIRWTGETARALLLHDGTVHGDFRVSDNDVFVDDGQSRLAFLDHAVLRKGPLISTVLANMPGIVSLLPQKILHLHECKWLSRSELTVGRSAPTNGWSIHEIVRFS